MPVSVFIIMTRIHPGEHKVRCFRAIFNRNFLHFVNFRPMNWYQFSHRVNNWYQYVTDFIPIFFMCERNMHVVKIPVAIMQIPHIDKVSHKAAAFYIGTHSIVRSRRQLIYLNEIRHMCELLVPILLLMRNWCQFFSCVRNCYQFFGFDVIGISTNSTHVR